MRILIVGINFFPELTGIGKYTGELAAYLAANGNQVHVITAPPYYPYWQVQAPYHASEYRQEDWQGSQVTRCPLYVPRHPSGLTRLLHLFSFAISSFPVLLRESSWHADIVMCIAPAFFNAPFALFSAYLSGSKACLHIQDFELDAAFSLGLLSGNNWIQRAAIWMESAVLRRFDMVSTISNQMLERLLQKGVEKERAVIFPNWIDTEAIQPLSRPSQFREEWGIKDNQVVVLYAGNMGRKQGLELLLMAARSLVTKTEIIFILCGDGSERQQLEADAQDLPNLRFYPLQPIERLNELLNLADIHVLPQRADAADLVMPSKLSGMLASGGAVIATAHADTELGRIINNVGLLAIPGDVSCLVKLITELADNPKERKLLGQKGRNWVLEEWATEHVLGKFQSQLQDMIK